MCEGNLSHGNISPLSLFIPTNIEAKIAIFSPSDNLLILFIFILKLFVFPILVWLSLMKPSKSSNKGELFSNNSANHANVESLVVYQLTQLERNLFVICWDASRWQGKPGLQILKIEIEYYQSFPVSWCLVPYEGFGNFTLVYVKIIELLQVGKCILIGRHVSVPFPRSFVASIPTIKSVNVL